MGLSGTPNDYDNEGDYLARVRVEALRCEGLRAYGTGNLRGLTTGKTFVLEGHPQKEVNQSYLVVSTSLDVRNADELTIRPGTDAHYHCTTDFVLQPANAFFKLRAQPKPRAHAETAVVVGPENQPLWLDGYARVRVQFKWDRLGQHDQDSSCWVRVSLPWHGGPHSFIAVPRIGDELTIGYHEGDPDKPFVASSKVNQFNAPPFALPKNMALTGLVSHALEGQGHNYVVTDDTPGQQQVQVASDQANSRLVLGANTRIVYGDGRQDRRGEGFELATHSHGVLRANSGMLVTTASRDGASAPAKDMGETLERLAVAHDQQDTFATLAREQMAQESGDQDDVAQALQSQHDEIRGQGTANAPGGVFPELASAHLVLNGEAGLVGVTPASLHLASGEHMALSAGGHVGMSVGKRLLMSVARGVRTLVQSAGWKLVAMSGDIELNALKDTDAHYHCTTDFVLQPANAFFKLRAQPKPRAHAETAVVVGPENQPLWLDGYARVRVQFKWDRLGQHDQDSSCWVRVSLPWHGGPHSFIAVPRIGDELTIGYHEGDPDKPFVASSKVNQFNAPPFALPKNMALTGSLTRC